MDAAGIREPDLRRGYSAQRESVTRFRRASYLAARLLLPKLVLPHAVATTAVMHYGDNLLDTGPKPQRVAAWTSWEQEVRKAFVGGGSAGTRAGQHSAPHRPAHPPRRPRRDLVRTAGHR
ncbi:hypothetical protein GCM10010469_35210 [Streptomyces labedae]|uniref:Uncharacterized protein n=2 Tax=Streptomyces TaxID=1883 RepID=A0ABQ2U239_9ACTN|nr:hypothetical protein GCM10010265_58720 [Streptomyces griseoincarnatus]GGT58570.1 hypothetical protein GCM10010287_35900 [Streptomyces variabilis]